MELPPDSEAIVKRLSDNFLWVSVSFALSHGCVTTPIMVVSTLLGKDVAAFGNGVLYSFTLLSSLFLGAPLASVLGPKGGLLFGMFFYCIYVAGFSLAALFKDVEWLMWTFFIVGSAFGGTAAGVLWTAQGGYFASTSTQIAEAAGEQREAVTARLSGNFAFIYLVFEVGSKLVFSGLQLLEVPTWEIGVLYLLIGLLGLGMMSQSINTSAGGAAGPVVRPRMASKVLAAASLWSDPLIWLLCPTNLTFGFCAAFMNGTVDAEYASKELGPDVVAFLGAITAATAAIMAIVFRPMASRFGKGPVISLGAFCFFSIPCCILVLGCCSNWGWGLILLYLFQGTGRAVYESTNRATFSDFFTGEKTEGAFANCMMQSSFAFAFCFFLQAKLSGGTLSVIVLVLSVSTPICYGLALQLQRRRLEKATADPSLAISESLHSSREC
ncbi:unnamed protein product [Polarella glacialis]|uniref:Uncharacterized protein n=1 Tax=Polarella glacialis TaxID=89957 RepID=A0A813FTA7_POLGL|nr:unnamed protein product [Polarella glacialis]